MPRGWVVGLILICTALKGRGDDEFFGIPGRGDHGLGNKPSRSRRLGGDRGYPRPCGSPHKQRPARYDLRRRPRWAAGAWAADRYLDRIFNRSRTDAHRPRVP